MKNGCVLVLCLLMISNGSVAQTPTFTNDIASLIWENCSPCHYNGGLPNATLITYSQVSNLGLDIKARVNSTDAFYKMPPWTPNPNYRHYAHERVLTDAEINSISIWVDSGMPAGDTSLLPPVPNFAPGPSLGPPDLKLTMPLYQSKATVGQEDYVCFTLPTGLATTKIIKAIEVVPGNYGIVHHGNVFRDSSGFQTDTLSHNCNGSAFGQFVSGFVPGVRPVVFPNNDAVKMGIRIAPNEDIVLSLHYHEGSGGQWDSTSVYLYFYEDSVSNVREVKTMVAIDDYSFCFNPNTVDSLERVFPAMILPPNPTDISMLSVVTHAHQLAQSFLVFMVDNVGDTIPLIEIPQWNFEWQDIFFFEYLQKFPAGSRIYGKAIYDNTINNPYNPNSPPQTVCAGQNSTDEMFTVFYHYVDYLPGDEYINIDSATQVITATHSPEVVASNLFFEAFPNPFNDKIVFNYLLDKEKKVTLGIYNLQGQLIVELVNGQQNEGLQHFSWNGKGLHGQVLSTGVYVACLRVGGKLVSKKIVLK